LRLEAAQEAVLGIGFFIAFGEPDIDVHGNGNALTVEIKGVDVYDPTAGQIRNSSTDDIACWLIDTDYNGERFFVRQAYFTGADEPYEKAQASPERRDRRGGMVVTLQHREPGVSQAGQPEDRGESDQLSQGMRC
jgi:hypothetical protein